MISTSSYALEAEPKFTLGESSYVRLTSWRRTQRPSSSISSSEVLPADELVDRARMTPTWISRVFRRVADLSKRPDDWDSYGGSRLRVEILRAFVQVLDAYAYAIQTEPVISLTAKGGLLCSWQSSQASVDLTFDPDEPVHVYFEDVITGHEFDLSLRECETLEKWLWQASSSS